jgi:hypothetical protein
MKNTLRKSIAVVLFLAALTPARALAAATVYAEEAASDSVVAATAPVAESNAPATKVNETNVALSEKASVRIDKNGVHIGGAHPVDINAPSLANHHRDKGESDVVGLVAVVFGCSIGLSARHGENQRAARERETETMVTGLSAL